MIFDYAQNTNGLAAILGHEMAHYTLGHRRDVAPDVAYAQELKGI